MYVYSDSERHCGGFYALYNKIIIKLLLLNPHTGNNITTTMYRRKLHSYSEMRDLVNRTAIHVLSQNHRIRDKMLHACTSRGATCTVKQGRIVQTQNFIFGRFSNFFLLSKWDLDPPTHFQIIFGFLNFLNFAKPLSVKI